MKLRINAQLRSVLKIFQDSAYIALMTSSVIGTSIVYNLHAVNNNLAGVGGNYTLTEIDGVKKLTSATGTVDYTGTLIFQETQADGILENMAVHVESGTHSVSILGSGGQNFDAGTAEAPIQLAISVSGDSNITFGIDSLLYAWSQDFGVMNVYADTSVNVDTTGTVGALILTTEANSNSTNRKFYGNQNVSYTAGIVGVSSDPGFSHLSVAAGAKAAQIIGDINYSFGEIGADDSVLSFEGAIYGGIVNKEGTVNGKVTGNTNITLNSGTFKNVFGAGEGNSSHEGNVTINYNGGTISDADGANPHAYKIRATAGASISGVATLNVGAALNSTKVAMGSFDVINTVSATGNLNIDNEVTIGTDQTLSISEASSVTVSDILRLDGALDLAGGSLVNHGTLTFSESVLIDLTDIGGSEGNLIYSIFTGAKAENFRNLSWENVTGVLGISESTHIINFTSSGNVIISERSASWTNNTPSGAAPLTWAVGAASTSDASDTFLNGDNVVFSGNTIANISGNIFANSVTISDNSTLTLGLTAAGDTLEGNSISLGTNSQLNINGSVLFGEISFIGGISSGITFASGDYARADDDFLDFNGELTVTSGTLTLESRTRLEHLSAVNLGDGVTLYLSEILSNTVHRQLDNVKGGDNSTLSIAFIGQSGDTANNNNGRVILNNDFTGSIVVREGQFNITFSSLGGAQKIIIGNDGTGSNSGLYFNAANSFTYGSGVIVEVKDGTTGYLAQDNGTHDIGSTIIGGTDTALRKIDVGNLSISGDMSGFLGELQVAANTFTIKSSTATNISGISIANNTTFAVGNGGHVSSPHVTIAAGTATLNVLSGGTLTLNNGLTTAANTLNLNVRDGGTLNLGHTSAGSIGTINTTIEAGATINATSEATSIVNDLVFTGSGDVILSASDANATVSIEGAISGSAGLSISGQAGQTFIFDTLNTYEGGTKIADNTKVQTNTLAAGTVSFSSESSLLDINSTLILTGKSSGGSISLDAEDAHNTFTGVNVLLSSTKEVAFNNASFDNTAINLETNSILNLNGATLAADSNIAGNGATLISTDLSIQASASGGSLELSSNTAQTSGENATDIGILYSVTSIDVTTVELSGSLSLTVDLADLTGVSVDDFLYEIREAYVGFEFTNVERADFLGDFNDVSITVTNGATTLISGAALGVTVSSAGNITFYVPEPSTVTMSILALTALLARRRRKRASC